MHDVACEFACAIGRAETISANVLKIMLSVFKLFLKPYQKHITPKRLNSVYMLGTMLGFLSGQSEALNYFLPKYGISELKENNGGPF